VPPRIAISRGPLPIRSYVERIRAAGAEPIEVMPGDPIPRGVAGVCLSGGPDVQWERYAQANAGSGEPDLRRDELELDQLLPMAFAERLPILAICRGIQVLNVHLGGTLVQDIGEAHRAKENDVKPHAVRVEPASRLADACGPSFMVNSRHHQVIDRLGRDLVPVAWADGHVEGAEIPGEHWVVGVQWHPERVQDGVPNNGAALFDAFVRVAGRVPAR